MTLKHDAMPGARRSNRAPLVLVLLLLVSTVVCCMVGLGSGVLIGKLTGGLSREGERHAVDRVPPRVTTRAPSGWRHAPTPTKMRWEATATPTTSLPPSDHLAGEEPKSPSQDNSRSDIGTAASTGGAGTSQTTKAPLMGLPADQPRVPATRLVIPKLGVDAPVVLIALRDGIWQVDQLTYEVGHLQGTASPGDSSNIAIAGHVTLARGGDGPFRYLSQLRQGDEVLVFAGEQPYRYVVNEVRVVSPEDVQVTFPTADPTLTLITCANWNRERRVYDDRVIAIARLAQ
jgi:LPXTG-site transpeptidase (sortase) family protein